MRRQEIETENYSVDAIDMNPYFGKQFEVFVRNEFARTFLPGYFIGRWWYRGEEVDLVAVRENDGSIVIGSIGPGECKWGKLTEQKARLVLSRLIQKAEGIRHEKYPNERFTLIAVRIEGKDRLRAEGFLVYDLEDIEAMC